MKFTDYIANYIVEEDLNLDHLTVVLPSERMKKYLVRSLSQRFGRPIVAPKMITIDRLIREFSQRNIVDSTTALIDLFAIHVGDRKELLDEEFDEFMNWGQTLLSDFNEIDRYLLTAEQVFRNLADIKEIEQWSFGEDELTDRQKKFMEFWDRLPGYYHELNKVLNERGCCYPGSAFREVAQNIDRFFDDKEMHYMFAGFNALSASELTIIKQLDQLGRAHVLIDADEAYLSEPHHEAGRFLRELSSFLDGKKLPRVAQRIGQESKEIRMIACAQKTGQVKVASTLLEQLSDDELNDTMVLLADETLIGALLKNIPARIGKANITLGLQIRNTSLRTWIDLLFSIQENKTRFRTEAHYFFDLRALLGHPFVRASINDEEAKLADRFERKMMRQNRIFVANKNLELGEKTKSIIDLLYQSWTTWDVAIETIRGLNKLLYRSMEQDNNFERAILESFDKGMIEFENIVQAGLPQMSMRSFKQLFNQHWSQKSIAYHGNPLEGIQIMGLLETRGLDFKNIICLGMNEGNLPPTNPILTLIPMDLRRFLGLPTPREKQGLFAHHFYRLMHDCENLTATYFNADESIGSNEPSRYLTQLELEMARRNSQMRIKHEVYTLTLGQRNAIMDIPKSPQIMDRTAELLANSTSASMIKKYLDCPLDFYFRYVMDFGEADDVEEDIEHSTFGTFIHDTLEILYAPFARVNKDGSIQHKSPPALTSLDIERMLKDFKVVLNEQFLKHFHGDKSAFNTGKNLLSYQMAIELTKRFLKSERDFISQLSETLFIESLEREYSHTVVCNVQGEERSVHLRGFVDRVDRIGDNYRIIDYKTGKVDEKDVQLLKNDESHEDLASTIAKKKHVLQLMMYAYLFRQEHDVIAESSIISMVSNKHQCFSLDLKSLNVADTVDAFPNILEVILEGLFDLEVPFSHNSDQFVNYCKYCE